MVIGYKLVRLWNCLVVIFLVHFGDIGSFSKHIRLALSIIWILTVRIIRKERKGRIFQQKDEQLQNLCEKIKHQSFCSSNRNMLHSTLITIFGGLIIFISFLLLPKFVYLFVFPFFCTQQRTFQHHNFSTYVTNLCYQICQLFGLIYRFHLSI